MSNESSSITLSSNAVKRIQTLLPNQESNYLEYMLLAAAVLAFNMGLSLKAILQEMKMLLTLKTLLSCLILFHTRTCMDQH